MPLPLTVVPAPIERHNPQHPPSPPAEPGETRNCPSLPITAHHTRHCHCHCHCHFRPSPVTAGHPQSLQAIPSHSRPSPRHSRPSPVQAIPRHSRCGHLGCGQHDTCAMAYSCGRTLLSIIIAILVVVVIEVLVIGLVSWSATSSGVGVMLNDGG